MGSISPNILTLDEFDSKFDVKEFVGTISERLINESKTQAGPFDAKPFISEFESAVDKLISLRKEIQAKTEQMEKSVRVSEREYSKKMTELNRRFEAVGTNFNSMENQMNQVGRTAIRIGEQLESVHIERQRAQAAYDLFDFFNSFSKDDTTRIDALKKEGREGRRQVATILRRLNIVAKEVDLPNVEKTRENIDRYCEKFEKDILYLFDRSYRKGEPKVMHHCAQTLLDFNGGNSCVQVYVNQHDFFINRVAQVGAESDAAIWQNLGDPDIPPPKTEKGLSDLFGEIKGTVEQEAEIVRVVFPNPPMVMQVFLQRVFAQSIQQHMEQLLNQGSSISELGFLRVLQLVHEQTAALVESLKMHELPTIIPRSPQDSTEFRRSLVATTSSSGSSAAMSVMLETAMEELFAPYTEGSRYIDKECKCLTDLYAGLLSVFAKYHARAQAGTPTVLGRMLNQLGSSTGTPAASGQTAAALMRFGGIGAALLSSQTQDKSGEEPLRDEDGQLSIDLAEKMLKWHAETVGRCVEMTSPADIPKHISTLLRVLSGTLGTGYVGTALESTLSRLDSSDGKLDTYLRAMSTLHSADLICHLWQQYVNVALFPLGSSSVAVRREMTVLNSQTMSRIEGAANQVVQRVIDGIIAWLNTQLAKQKRTDFKPRNDDSVFTRVNTEVCALCCDGLQKVHDAAQQNLSGKNLEVFLTEIGVSFHALLLDHFRKFPVSDTGGLMLAKDVKSYQDTVGAFNIPPLSERFEFLRQLGQIFLLTPEALKSYLTEDYLGRIDANLLKPYLAQRSDWGQSERILYDGAPAEAPVPDTKNAGAFGSRFARLSTMMKDIEVKSITDSMGHYVPNVKGLQNISGITGLPMPSIPTNLPNRFSLTANRIGY